MSTKILISLSLGLLLALLAALPAGAQMGQFDPGKDIGIDQKLDAQLPLDVTLRDETGKNVRLGEYFGKKPVILMLIFYRCMGTCTLELEGILKTLVKMPETVGSTFDIVVVSIHPKETPELAAGKKKSVMEDYKRPSAASGWHFLTGDLASIRRVTDTVGFRYLYDEKKDQIAHPAGIMIATPQGRLSKYFYGTDYPTAPLRAALTDAAASKIGTKSEPKLLGCLQYDPTTGKYRVVVMKSLQVAGIATAALLGLFIAFSLALERIKRRKQTSGVQAAQ